MLVIDFGVLAFSWWALERVWYRQYFRSNLIGDTIGLPAIAGFTTVILTHLPNRRIQAWYTTTWWYLGVLGVGVVIIAAVTYMELHTGNFNWKQEVSPSKAWHTLAWPAFFWILVAPAPAALALADPLWPFLGVIVGIGIWTETLMVDLDCYPTPLGGVVEFSWAAFFRREHPSRIRRDQWINARIWWPRWYLQRYNSEGERVRVTSDVA